MLRLAVLVLSVALSLPASAEVARVSGGEHKDFTRLVVEAANPGAWRLGRAADGYELELDLSVTSYDVTRAFEKIPRDRLAALWRDPESGRLRFALACACHAVAFEFRAGTVVIDIRSGPPPDGSAFEEPLDGDEAATRESPVEPLATSPEAAGAAAPPDPGRPAAYDWVALERARTGEAATGTLPLPTGGISLDPLRDALLSQISRGVAAGVLELTDRGPPAPPPGPTPDGGPWARVAVGELPGLRIAGAPSAAIAADGASCTPDDRLDVAAWGPTGPVAAQFGLARSGMLAEFDATVPDAVIRSVRFMVAIGFGAEARQSLLFLGGQRAEDARILEAMARIVDGEAVTSDPFAGQESCDTAAALWATLAQHERGHPLPRTNAAAVARAFSALPATLRRHLGTTLVDMFIAGGDPETARMLRDAILRLPAEHEPEVALMNARYALATGDEAAAASLAAAVLDTSGPASAEAAITLVEAAFRGDRRIDPGLPSTLAAFLGGDTTAASRPALLRARVLADAMAGNFPAAFAHAPEDEATVSDLWSLAATDTADDLFLEQAALRASRGPVRDGSVSEKVARRLLALGFPDLALNWWGPVDARSPEGARLFAAAAQLALRDAPAAMALTAGLAGAEAEEIRAVAALQLGDARAAAESLQRAGNDAAALRALVWTEDWPLVGNAGPEIWRIAAGIAAEAPPLPEGGPISRGTALADESAAARRAIADLLDATTKRQTGP